jgi:glycogen debranching enzyme
LDYREREAEAGKVIAACRKGAGFHASSHLYPELWIRDLVFSEDVLLRLGYRDAVRGHLEEFLKRQRSSGQLPTVITAPYRRILNQSFHSWTADTEVLCLIGLSKYANFTRSRGLLKEHSSEIDRCLEFVEGSFDSLGLLPGMDWRDAIPNYAGEDLLANQVLLVEAYDLMGRKAEADALGGRIREEFHLPGRDYLADSIGRDGTRSSRVDSLGNSLAIMLGVLEGERSIAAAEALLECRTEHGFVNLSPPHRVRRLGSVKSLRGMNAFLRNGAVLRNRAHNYQNSAIWPFVESRIANAFLKVGRTDDARHLARLMLGRRGFGEWYSPVTGEPRGSRGQLWTAAAVLEAAEILRE